MHWVWNLSLCGINAWLKFVDKAKWTFGLWTFGRFAKFYFPWLMNCGGDVGAEETNNNLCVIIYIVILLLVLFENTKKSKSPKSKTTLLDLFAKLGWKIGAKKGGLLPNYLFWLWNFITFALWYLRGQREPTNSLRRERKILSADKKVLVRRWTTKPQVCSKWQMVKYHNKSEKFAKLLIY